MSSKQSDEKPVSQAQFGTFIEHMNDQFERVLEAVTSSTEKIPRISERLENVESDINHLKITTFNLPRDLKLIKNRTEKIEDIKDQLENNTSRIADLEAA